MRDIQSNFKFARFLLSLCHHHFFSCCCCTIFLSLKFSASLARIDTHSIVRKANAGVHRQRTDKPKETARVSLFRARVLRTLFGDRRFVRLIIKVTSLFRVSHEKIIALIVLHFFLKHQLPIKPVSRELFNSQKINLKSYFSEQCPKNLPMNWCCL